LRFAASLPLRRRKAVRLTRDQLSQPCGRPAVCNMRADVLVLSGDTWCEMATSTRSNPLKTLRSRLSGRRVAAQHRHGQVGRSPARTL